MVRPRTRPATDFGSRLAQARRNAGMTQMQLAGALGVSQQIIDYYERRAKNPTLTFIQRAAKALEISLAELLGETAKPTKKRRSSEKK